MPPFDQGGVVDFSSLGDAVVVTAGYDVIITTVSRNSSNISEVAFYVSANNGSVVMDARDVMEALKVFP